MEVHYLEIVTPDVEATCAALAAEHGVAFADPSPALGGARVVGLDGGGSVGVRAPLRDTEAPVVRPYLRVGDIGAALDAAVAAGGEVAMVRTPVPDASPVGGAFAIYILGGIEHGLWEVVAKP